MPAMPPATLQHRNDMNGDPPGFHLADGVLGWDRVAYRGKHYHVPRFDPTAPLVVEGRPERAHMPVSPDGGVVAGIHGVFDVAEFLRPRRPASLGVLEAAELAELARPGAPRVLDMPIKFPDDATYRLPRALA